MAAKNEVAASEKKSENKITLKDEPLFASQTSPIPIKRISGEFYFYDGKRANGRTRICKNEEERGKFPAVAYCLGWICK